MNYDMNFIKYLWNKKTSEISIYKISEVFWIEATTRFELVIRVLQTIVKSTASPYFISISTSFPLVWFTIGTLSLPIAVIILFFPTAASSF